MDFQSGVRARLLANGLVSGAVGTRIDWGQRPQGAAYPAIVLQTISDPRPAHLKDYEETRSTLVQLDVYSDVQSTRDSAADALVAWLDNYRGMMGSWNATIQVRNKPRSWEPDSRLYRCMIELEILYLN